MTTSKKRERERRAERGGLVTSALASLRSATAHTREWYRTHIVEYFDEVLGVTLTPQQAELARAVQDHDRVAGRSGRRTGKSTDDAGIALWWYDCFDGRCIMTSATARQVDSILWREVTLLRARAKRPIEGSIGVLARTGLRDGTGREIVGFTAREGEAMQGFAASARNPLLFIVDEASGVEQAVFDAIEGNRAGGGKILLTGNPTKTSGEFFDAFHSKKRNLEDPASTGYVCVHLSTEEAAKHNVPGLATPEYVRERAAEWGTDSPLYKVHVQGEFAIAEDGRIFTLELIEKSKRRWAENEGGPPTTGRLQIGVDPAGPGGAGDESAFAARRGDRILQLIARRGLTPDGHVAMVLGMAKELGDGVPLVALDREGPVGALVLEAFLSARERGARFELMPIRSSDRARRRPLEFERVRDELAANLHDWMRRGGQIPEDTQLDGELHSLEWETQVTGRLKLTRKDKIRRELGRSPDRYDAVALACWERARWLDDLPAGDDGGGDDDGGDDDLYDGTPSPYGDDTSPYD